MNISNLIIYKIKLNKNGTKKVKMVTSPFEYALICIREPGENRVPHSLKIEMLVSLTFPLHDDVFRLKYTIKNSSSYLPKDSS